MNLIRTAFPIPKRLFLLPNCTILIQQFSSTAKHTTKHADSAFSSWRDLVENPADWCDYREDKSMGLLKQKYPDFKHKTYGIALWLNSAPNWVLQEFNVAKGKKEDSWKNLVENPDKWWDSRPRKTNVKYPDFVNKETNEGLWLDNAPKEVLARLEGVVMGKRKKGDSWKNLVENPDRWFDNRPRKSDMNRPDFIHKETREGLWLDSSPKWVLRMLEGLDVETGEKEDSWMDLVENPEKWWDIRQRKTGVKMPDFRRKETSEGLWLNNAPKWVFAMLEGLNVGKGKRYDSWINLVENPDKWWDIRPRKTDVKAPDFRHKETSEVLYISASPKWVLPMLEGLVVGKGKKEDSWKDLVENPDKWWDDRSRKIKVNWPDFRHKETHEGLWLDNAPKWILARVEGLTVGKGEKEDSWKNLVENPDKWWDNRPSKINTKMPDFRHKETKEGLWLSSCPTWALSQLPC